MKRVLIWLGLALVALAVCVWRLPASLMAVAIPPEASRFVQLHGANGTLWNGRAELSAFGVPPALAIAWNCRPTFLPLGARCDLSDSISGSLTVSAVSGTLGGEQLVASIPLEVTPATGVSAGSGRVVVTINNVTLSTGRLALKATLRADDARYRIGQTSVQLGEISADCVPNADGMSSICTVANRGGNARLDGRITLTSNKASGTLDLTPGNGPVQRVTF